MGIVVVLLCVWYCWGWSWLLLELKWLLLCCCWWWWFFCWNNWGFWVSVVGVCIGCWIGVCWGSLVDNLCCSCSSWCSWWGNCRCRFGFCWLFCVCLWWFNGIVGLIIWWCWFLGCSEFFCWCWILWWCWWCIVGLMCCWWVFLCCVMGGICSWRWICWSLNEFLGSGISFRCCLGVFVVLGGWLFCWGIWLLCDRLFWCWIGWCWWLGCWNVGLWF